MCKKKKVAGRILRCFVLSVCLSVAWGMSLNNAAAQQPNDDFSSPRLIGDATGDNNDTGTIAGNTEGASVESGELDHASPGGASVWFVWTPTADGVFTFDTIGSDFDTLLEIYDGTGASDIGSLVSLGSNDDVDPAVFGVRNATGVSSVMVSNIVAGNTYYIVVDGFMGNTGSYQLNWKRGGTRASGEFEFTSSRYFATADEGILDYSDANGHKGVNRDVPGVLITVTRKNGSSGRVLVDYETQEVVPDPENPDPTTPAPAVPDIGFTSTSGTLVFEDFQMSASFIVPIHNANFFGSGSNAFSIFNVALTGARLDSDPISGLDESPDLSPPIISPLHSVSTVAIADPNPFPHGLRETPDGTTLEDAAGSVQFERAHYRRTEGVGVAHIAVVRRGGTDDQQKGAVTVEYQIYRADVNSDPRSSLNFFPLSAGSDYATPDTEPNGDYTVEPQIRTLTIPANSRRAFIDIPITDDLLAEFNEDIIIQLVPRTGSPSPRIVQPTDSVAATGYEIGFQNVAILTIMHDDYPAGAVDPTFNPDYDPNTNPARNPAPGTDGSVYSIAVQPDGKTIIGGSFQIYNGSARSGIARVNNDGSLDATFNPGIGANDFVSSVKIAPGGKILIGGGFSSFAGVGRKSVALLNANGTLDTSFDIGTGANGIVRAVAIQGDGKILVAGEFTMFNGTSLNRVARLDPDGSVDGTFNPGLGPNDTVFSMAAEASGSILIGGDFTSVGGSDRHSIARLNSDGTVADFSLGSGADGAVYSIVTQPDGKILIGGDFTTVSAVPRNSIARLNPDGSLDQSFDCGTGADGVVYALARQSDGKILLGGLFTSINGTRRMGIARLFPHGPVDTSFMDTGYNQFAGLVNSFDNLAINPRNYVFALGLESGGNVIIGGGFSKVGGGRGSKEVRPSQYNGNSPFGNYLDENTRATYRNRSNIARLIGGATPGPGNIEFSLANYSVDQSASPIFVTLVRTNYSNETNFLGAAMASFAIQPLPAGSGAASELDVLLDPKYGNVRWGSSWNRTNKNAVTRMQSDGFYGLNSATRPFSDTYVAGELFPSEGEAFVYLDIKSDAAMDGDKTIKLELKRPKGARIYDRSGFSSLDFDERNPGRIQPLDSDRSPYFYFDPRPANRFSQTDPNVDWSLGGEYIPLGTALGRSSATLTIRGKNNSGEINITAPEFVVNEGETNAVVYVSRTNGAKNTITVQYQTQDGTAIKNLDYTPASGTLTFADGDTNNKAIYIHLIDNAVREGDENFTVRLFNPTRGAKLGDQRSTSVKIIDDDYPAGHLNFTSTNFVVGEEGSLAVVTVSRTGGSSGTVTAEYSTAPGGSAIDGQDYTRATGILTWNSGDVANKTFTVPILNDGLVEGTNAETISLRLTNSTVNATPDTNVLGSVLDAQIQIVDDDEYGSFGFNAATYYANENSGGMIVTVARTGGSAGTVSLTFTASGGIPISTNLTFVSGETSKGILVPIADDVLQNSNLDVALVLSNLSPSEAILGRSNATLIVVDDESNNEPPGGVDTTFDVGEGANDYVHALALQPNGKLLVGGDFTSLNGVGRNRIARLNLNGSVDTHFSAVGPNFGANGSVRTIVPQTNGRILIGGFFSNVNGADCGHITRLNSNGTSDITFNPGSGADSAVHAIAETFVDGDRKILVAGNFTTFNELPSHGIVRLNDNGTVDSSFNPGIGISSTNGTVYCLAVQSDGGILLGGDFVSFNGAPSPHIVRLKSNGSIDPTFNPGIGPDSSVRAIAVQTDGRILIGGIFTNVAGNSLSHIARLNSNGSVDSTFTPGLGANDSIFAIALQVDGKILAGGEFTQASGVTRNRLTRLNPDGTVDPTINFGTGADNFVSAIAVQEDGKIFIGGGFTEFDGNPRPHIARLQGRTISGDGSIEFVSAEFVGNENGTNAVITVRRTGGTGSDNVGPVYVTVSTSDGTAQSGLDYDGVTNTLVFPVGETRQVFTVPMRDDDLVESDETVHLTLSNPTDAALGDQPVATLTIRNDDAAIGFASPTFRFAENTANRNAIIEIVRTGSSMGAASVDFIMTTNGTATPDVDFTMTTNAITVPFAEGETSKTVAIPLADDFEIEGDETVTLELTNAFNAILSSPVSAALTIVDDDLGAGSVAFLQPTYTVSETGGVANITLIRTNGSTGIIGVKYTTIGGGTAASGIDYAPTNGTVSFGPGELSKSFSVRIFDDSIAEMPETILLLLSDPSGGATIAGTNSVPLVIDDNEIALSFSTPAYVVNEGDGGATIRVLRSSGTNESVTVFYETSDITATNNSDYLGKTNSATATNALTFLPGETFKTFTVPILEDSDVEGSESFAVRLFDPSSNAQLATPSNAVVTIIDNDSRFSFATNSFAVDEGGTNVIVTIVRTNTSIGEATIDFATSNETALAGADFTATNGTITFLDGEFSHTVLIPIVDDASVEGDESFAVVLSNPGTGAVLGEPSIASVQIIDNDAGLRFSSPTYSVSESGVSATITVLRTAVTNTTVSVNYTTADGTAADGQDYSGSFGTLTFTNGETAKSFTVPLIDDTAIEGDETVLLTLSSPSPGSAIVNPGAAVLRILDNDGSLIVPAGSALISESGPVNGVIDPSENVTLYFAFRNTVGADTANLIATLLPGNGVTSPSGAQDYGVLNVGGASVSRPFSFTASGTNGQQIMATFHLQDGPFDLGTGTFTYTLGSTVAGFSNTNAIVINDSVAPPTLASPYPSTINVTGIVGTVSQVTVTLSNLSHTFPDDIDVLLVSPSGHKIVLMSDAGGGSANAITNRTITFDDFAANNLSDSTLISSGTYKPTDYIANDTFPVPAPAGPYDSTLSALDGTNPNGTWSLYVADDLFFNSGSIAQGWSLAITSSSGLTPTADLSLSMSDSPDPAATGNDLTYTLTVTNHGPSAATDIVITNLLPPGVTFVSQSSSCTNINGSLVCPTEILPKDGVVSFNIVVSPDMVGVITNTATVRANENDPNLFNNTASEATTVDIPRADLSVTVSDSPDPVQINTDLTYSIIVSNLGPAMAESVALTNTLPPGTRLLTASSIGGTQDTNTAGVVVFNWTNLISGSFRLGTITVQFPAPGTVTNIARAGSATLDPFKANNTAGVKTIVELPPLNLGADVAGLSITWATNAPNYVIESTTNLSDIANWLPVTNATVITNANGENKLIIDYSEGSRFFRLSPRAP